ncbi:MAG: glycosyltransferase family 4 protein [Bacteroidota bacterium]
MSDKITVLHLINTMEWGGVRKHVLDLADGLVAHGVRSFIAAWIPPGDALHEDPRVLSLPLYDEWNTLKSPKGFVVSIRKLRVLLGQENVRMVHMHSRYATLLGSLAIRGSRIDRVYTVHNTFDDLKWMPWYPSDVIAPASTVREHFLANVRGSEKIHIQTIAHGVGISPLPPASPASPPRFCFAGRLREEKGVRVLYDALLRLRNGDGVFPGIDIVGDGPLFTWLQEKIKEDFPGNQITMHGYMQNPAPLIAGAAALLFPSVRLDSAPYINLEAMAMGVPVIASNIDALRDLVVPDETGIVFPAGDAAALAEALRYAADHPETMSAMGMRGKELVREHHGLERMCAETAAFYRVVMKS